MKAALVLFTILFSLGANAAQDQEPPRAETTPTVLPTPVPELTPKPPEEDALFSRTPTRTPGTARTSVPDFSPHRKETPGIVRTITPPATRTPARGVKVSA